MREKAKNSMKDEILRSVGGVPDRHWTDGRDGVDWMVWLETAGDRPVLAFGSEGNTHTVVVDFGQGLWDLSDEDLQRFLDETKFRAELGLPRPASPEEPGVETLPRTSAEPGSDSGDAT